MTYTKTELIELSNDQAANACSALLDESEHPDADTIRQRCVQAAAALKWLAETMPNEKS
jgi:hypothetical protein